MATTDIAFDTLAFMLDLPAEASVTGVSEVDGKLRLVLDGLGDGHIELVYNVTPDAVVLMEIKRD